MKVLQFNNICWGYAQADNFDNVAMFVGIKLIISLHALEPTKRTKQLLSKNFPSEDQ